MSIPRNMKVTCSKCGQPISVTTFQSVNTDYAENIAEQIISGELFNAKCSTCGFVSHLEYDMLYHDIKHMAMIRVVHKETPDYTSRIAETRSSNFIPYKTTRIVEDMNALREKVACLEQGRDDRTIELCKVFTAYNLLAKRPDFDFRNAYYTAHEGTDLIFLYDSEGNELTCELPKKAYDYLNELYLNSDYVEEFDDNYAIVDYEWAKQILIPLIEDEARNIETAKDSAPETKVSQEFENKSVFCRNCGAKLLEDSLFCDKCGTKVVVPQEEAPVQQRPPSSTVSQQKTNVHSVNIHDAKESKSLLQLELRKDRDIALQKRIATTKVAEKKKEIIKLAIAIAICVIVIALIVSSAVKRAHNAKSRNFTAEMMSDDYTNVYADIVSMEPEYFVYTSYNNSPYSISEIVCKCVTVEGKTIWAAINVWEYPGGSFVEERNEPQYYSKSTPKRIVGRVTTAEQVMDELETKIGDVFVLSVTEKVNK